MSGERSEETTPISGGRAKSEEATPRSGGLHFSPSFTSKEQSVKQRRAERAEKKRAQRKFLELDVLGVHMTQIKSKVGSQKQRLHTSVTVAGLTAGTWRRRLHKILQDVVQHKVFTLFVALLIGLNAAFVGWETDIKDAKWASFRQITNNAFTVVFTLELLLRFVARESLCEFFGDRGHLFDLVLVLVSCLDSFVLTPMLKGNGGTQIALLRVLRVVRLGRLLRTIRLIRLFKNLWLLVAGIFEAMWTLLWTWVLLFMLIYVFGIFATRTVGQHSPRELDPEIYDYFGTLMRSMFTLFQVTTTEGWPDIARLCMDRQPWTVVLFLAYLYITTFAVMNVVVAVIVENTVDQAGAQRQKFQVKQQEIMVESCVKIYEVFRKADDDCDGVITSEEFKQQIEDAEVRQGLQQLGIDMRQAENLFGILDYDESGGLDAEEFVGGMMKAVGLARAKDVLAVEFDLRRSTRSLHDHIGRVAGETEDKISQVEHSVSAVRQHIGQIIEALDQRAATNSSLKCGVARPESKDKLGAVCVDAAGGAREEQQRSLPYEGNMLNTPTSTAESSHSSAAM